MSDTDSASHPAFVQAYNIRRIRTARGLKQAELARRAGVPRVTATRAEGGAVSSSMPVLSALARALCVRIDDLMKAPPKNARINKKESTAPGRKAVR